MHVVYSPNDFFFPIGFKHFFHYIVHLVGPPPSLSPWFITLHLWPTFGPYEEPPFSLCSWWGEDVCPWCYVGCKISGFTWIDSHSFVTHLSFFTSTNQHCDFKGWYLDVAIIINDPTLTILVLQVVLSYGVPTTIPAQLRMHYNKMHPCLSNVFIGFWMNSLVHWIKLNGDPMDGCSHVNKSQK